MRRSARSSARTVPAAPSYPLADMLTGEELDTAETFDAMDEGSYADEDDEVRAFFDSFDALDATGRTDPDRYDEFGDFYNHDED